MRKKCVVVGPVVSLTYMVAEVKLLKLFLMSMSLARSSPEHAKV